MVLIFAKVRLEDHIPSTCTEEFRQATAIINLLTINQFLETTCTSIFKPLFAARSIKSGLFRLISIYFSLIEINSQRIQHLHCLI